MIMEIAYYDQYYDIPTRGLMRMGADILAFTASVLDDEPAALADRRGIYAGIRAFTCDTGLVSLFERQGIRFREWRLRYEQGAADESTHPMLVDQEYQSILKRIDEAFRGFHTPAVEATGTMRVISGKWVFEGE